MHGGAPTNLATMARGLVQWAEGRGLDGSRLLRGLGGAADRVAQRDARIPRESHVSVWREAERELGTPDFGLDALEGLIQPTSFGIVGLLAMTSPNAAECVSRIVRYGRLLKEDVPLRSYSANGLVVVELSSQKDAPRAIADCSIATYQHLLQRWTGRQVLARHVYFQHGAPDSLVAYKRVFDCPIRFNHPVNSIVFDASDTELPLTTTQPDIREHLEQSARSKLDELDRSSAQGREFPTLIHHAIRAAIEAGDVRLSRVARHLGMSVRTAQRELTRGGLDYRQLVDDARWAIAAPLLTLTDVRVESLAERLCYSDAKAFRRAFRRWTGVAPADMRGAVATASGGRALSKTLVG